ncbi:molecular chaperone TorD family protein [soil metagenome]
MSPLERAALTRFLAGLFFGPPGEDALELAGEVPELAPHLCADLAGDHSWLFDFNVYPYASVYLDPSGGLNAPWSGFVTGVYRALGLELQAGAGLAAGDHIAAELEAVTIMLEREAQAADEVAAARARHGQRALLFEQLLPWLPVLTHAVERVAGRGFYGVVAALTREALFEHADALLGGEAAPAFRFPEAEDELQHFLLSGKGRGPGKAGEARAALQSLITPARSGLFLSREDITRLGRRLELPVRFAERAFMLEALAQAAADQERLEALFGELRREAREQREAIERWGRAHPALAPVWEDWLGKLEATDERLLAFAKDFGAFDARDDVE